MTLYYRSLSTKVFKHRLKLVSAIACLSLVACGGDKVEDPNEDDPDNNPVVEGFSIQAADGSKIGATFTVPAEDADIDAGKISAIMEREKTEVQAQLSASQIMPLPIMWNYKEYLPHPELFCDVPSNSEFGEIAEELGGFQKTSQIYIEPDASAPMFQTGWSPYLFAQPGAAENADGSGGGVTIQRPNTVALAADKAFYLSDIYGLVTINYTDAPVLEPSISCALPLPGNAKNFVITDQSLFVLLEDLSSISTAVLQFDITGDAPVYTDGLVLEATGLLDARLFNDTLALYLENYKLGDRVDPVPVDNSGGGAFLADGPTGGISVPYYPREIVSRSLEVIDTLPNLAIRNSEVLDNVGEDNFYPVTQQEMEELRRWSYFENFVSASGEYLVIPERETERHFDGYVTRRRSRCTESRIDEEPYTYCSTNWVRTENPDYEPLPAGGAIQCTGDLWQCLKERVPAVARYVWVADGQSCVDRVRRRHVCLASEVTEYEVPEYHYEYYTNFHAFRFENGNFVRLDDQLAQVEGDQIIANDNPFRLPGRVQKHDHIRFIEDQLYVITNNYQTKQNHLNTLSILGNAAVYIDRLLIGEGDRWNNLSAIFSSDTLYLSEGSGSWSDMSVISLENPIKPSIDGSIGIPTQLQQLLFTDTTLIGVGRTSLKLTDYMTQTLGTITGFSAAGREVSSLVLGGNYRFFGSSVGGDDQLLTLDKRYNRLFYPYSVSYPIAGSTLPYSDYRLSISSFDNGNLEQEGSLSLFKVPERTLSVNSTSAFAFSDELIYSLSKDEGWESDIIFDGELPTSIYYSHEHPVHVQKYTRPGSYKFTLVDSEDGAHGDELDSLTVARATSSVCTWERVYFDNDRILIVREVPGVYISSQDCPSENSEKQFTLLGYQIGADSFSVIEDQQELSQLYRQILWNMVCITDPTQEFGEYITDLNGVNTDSMLCFTQDQYHEELNARNQVE